MKGNLFFNLFLGSIFGFQNPHILSDNQTIEPIIAIAFQPELAKHINHQQKQITSNRRTCNIYGYVTDKDPQGLNVRNAPNPSARIIKKLPTNTNAVFVDITASQGQWVEINRAEGDAGNVIFQGKGWVFASLLGTTTRGYDTNGVRVYSSPNNRTRMVGRIPPTKEVKILSCSGDWAYISYEQIRGWVAKIDQCANPLTTCP